MLTSKHKGFFETFELLMKLRSKDLSRFFKDAASFKPQSSLSRVLGFKRCYPLMYMVETASSSSNVTTKVLMTSLKEILHEGKMLSSAEIKEI